MSGLKRLDPHRPIRITPAGLKRIVLGDTGHGDISAAAADGGVKAQAKPLRLRQAPARWHMAIAHSDRGRLDEHARQAIAAAAILAAPDTGVLAVVLGELHESLASLGADRMAVLPEFDATRFEPERELAAVSALIADYKPEHVFLPDNLQGDGDLGRRLIAARSDSAATHVVEINAQHASIPWSGGAILARAALPRFVLLEAGTTDTNLPFVGAAELLTTESLLPIPEAQEVCRDLGLEEQDAASIALEEADFIVGAGNGVRNVGTLEELARTLGAAVGASRVAVDDGKFPRDKQIGATGKTVTASAYVAVGISGAVQHLQGIKDCRHVIAINRDAGAPIVKRADLTVIGDAEELMQALLTRIAQARAQRELPGQS
jgi:electron transfer flavoprotein alpha subunit